LYVADTGSTEEEIKALTENLQGVFYNDPRCTLLRYDYWNFGKINNHVIRNHVDKDTDIILLCNDDIELVDDAISYMVRAFTLQDEVGTIGCRLVHENGNIQCAGHLIYVHSTDTRIDTNPLLPIQARVLVTTPFSITNRGYGTNIKYVAHEPEEVVSNTGAFCMIPYNLFIDIGGFNEKYTYCFEDVEFSMECIKRGKTNFYLDYVTCIHYEKVAKMNMLDMDQEQIRENFDFVNTLQPYMNDNMKMIKKYTLILEPGEQL
jgi:cellulose synthase/poly-beta-1,6-N-acetylglucosamine synthase-like glycosyltransferase